MLAIESSGQPGVDQANVAVFEIGGVAGRQRWAKGPRDGRNLRVKQADGASVRAPVRRDGREGARRVFVEGKNASGKKSGEHRLRRHQQSSPAFPLRKQFDSLKDLSHADAGGK